MHTDTRIRSFSQYGRIFQNLPSCLFQIKSILLRLQLYGNVTTDANTIYTYILLTYTYAHE